MCHQTIIFSNRIYFEDTKIVPKIWDKWSDRISEMFLNLSEESEEK